MNELHTIHANLSEVEYGLRSLNQLLERLEESYSIEHNKEIISLLEVIIRQIRSLQEDLDNELDKLDEAAVGV